MNALCPCLDTLFAGVPDGVALRTLADLGCTQFEFWDWRDHDVPVLQQAESAFGLRPAVFSANTFDEPLLSRDAHPAALAHVRRSVDVARRLGTGQLVIHVGYGTHGGPETGHWQAAVTGLRAAAAVAADAGIRLLVEPLNTVVDHQGYFLDALPDAVRMVEEVGHPSVRLLLDVYHLWLMHPNLPALLPEAASLTGHVHLADAPGRHEPGTGSIPWPQVLGVLSTRGYAGLFGLECWPSSSPAEAIEATRRLLDAVSVRSPL